MAAGDDQLWCTSCTSWHPVSEFYRDRAGRPYGPCKESRQAASKTNRQRRAQELEELRRTLAAFRALATASPAEQLTSGP